MRINKEILEEKLNKASNDVREAIMSENTMNMLSGISKEFGLHIDQAGILEEEVLYTILGIQTSEEFIKRISKEFDISETVAHDIANEVNEKISGSIRNELQNKSFEKASGVKNSSTEINPSRESILSEIEDPTPSVNPISSVTQKPVPQVQPDPKPLPKPETAENKKSDDIAHDFIGGKLTESVNLPTKRATIDPYREALE